MEQKTSQSSPSFSQNQSYRRKFSNLSNVSDKEQQILQKQKPFIPKTIPEKFLDILDKWQFYKIQKQKKFEYDSGKQGNKIIGILPSDIKYFSQIYAHEWTDNDKDSPKRMEIIAETIDKFFQNESYLFKFYNDEDFNYYNFSDEKHFNRILTNAISEQTVKELDKMEKLHQNRELISQLNNQFLHNFKNSNTQYHEETYYPILVKATKTSTKCILKLVDECISDNIQYGFAFTRPSGHHSGRLYMGHHNGLNGVAIAAQYASKIYNKKVVIIDLDVDFAKGTIDIIQDNHDIYLFDIFSGFEDKTSEINLLNVVNYPIQPGSGDLEYIKTVKKIINYIHKNNINPDLILISCGFDAAIGEQDGCKISKQGYETIFNYILELQCKTLFQLEGGYNLENLGLNVESLMNSLTKKLQHSNN